MKTTLIILGALAISAHARNCWAPDKSARLECTSSIDLFDETSKTMMTLIGNADAAKEIEVSWSPDSQRVLVIESFDRGSVVFGAYKDGSGWHRVIEPDSDMRKYAEHFRSGLLSETRRAKGWSGDTVNITGEATGRIGARTVQEPFQYALHWRPGPGRLDRGGYEEGIISNE